MSAWGWRCTLCNVAGFAATVEDAQAASVAHAQDQHQPVADPQEST